MKRPLALLCLSLSTVIFLPSCEVLSDGGGGGYTGPYYGSGGGSYSRGYYDNGYGYSRPAYGNAYYGNSYNRGRYYNDGRNHDHDHDHDNDHRGSSSNNRGNSHNDEKIKLIGGRDSDKPNRPENYHSVDWYKNRGYNLSDYKHKHEDGDVHDPRKKSSSSSSKDKKKH